MCSSDLRLYDILELLRIVKISHFPDQTGTGFVDDNSFYQFEHRRATQDMLLARRGRQSDGLYCPKWLEQAIRQDCEKDF